ncbi:terminase [Loigolactobacillus backii]|uniref:PBSX family phage terminase large subunit n=1 Tax=Loigolactobacillus backii TaxID=375175 RepID=UPI000C1CA369|nr:PBSX family phage terminase large subunit [Loigolactobacillus backii]PIO83554.1 terminase [Loigolactobacillus backii]
MATAVKPKLIKMSSLINPHFNQLWLTDCPYIIAKGGRGSFKSSTIGLKLVLMLKQYAQQDLKANIICLRDNQKYLRDSVYGQVSWAIEMLDMTNEFKYRVSPMRITHKRTGSTFYFYGVSDAQRLKSNIVNNVIAIWYEEAANFGSKEDFDETNPTFVRQKADYINQVKVFYSYNPPRNPYDWVNEWIEDLETDNDRRIAHDLKPNYFIDTSTYLDDQLGITDQQTLDEIDRIKHNDKDYYRWLYLGEPVGLGTSVYNMDLFHPIKELPDDDYLASIYFSLDSGHEVSATTEGCYGITRKGNCILLDTYYYSPAHKSNKKAPSDLANDLHEFEERNIEQWDKQPYQRSADSATADYALDNEFYKIYNTHWHHVAKTTKVAMIDHVQNLLAQGKFFYLDIEANQIFIAEHRKYQWDADTVETDNPKVIKVDDHTCDQFQYFVLDNRRDLGLKW